MMKFWQLYYRHSGFYCLRGHKQGQAHSRPDPPMGWNSWDSYGTTIDEAQFKTVDWIGLPST